MRPSLTLLAALTVLLTTACTEDRFSQVVDIDIPEHESRPVLTLDIVGGDTVAWPYVDLSVGITDPEAPPTPATLQLFREGELYLETTTSTGNFRDLERPLLRPLPRAAADYEVVVNVDGYGSIRAEQRMPAVAAVELLSYDPEGAIDIDGFRIAEAIVRIQDPPGEENFYGFRVVDAGSLCNPDTCFAVYREEFSRYIESPDPLLRQAGYHGAVLTDESFDGDSYDVRLQFDRFGNDRALEVWAMTEDGFRYAVSLEAYDLAQFNPFAEPVNVHNNVEEGYGIFMASNRVRFVLEE